MASSIDRKREIKAFVERWKSLPCVEEEHSRSFWIEFVQQVLGIPDATHILEFERKVKGRKIDVLYEDMGILIEQKGRGISLDEATVRSKKAGLETPFQQAKRYADNLPYSMLPGISNTRQRFLTPRTFIAGVMARHIVPGPRSGSATTRFSRKGSSPRSAHSTLA